MFSIKHFMLGAALALLPLSLYGFTKLNPGLKLTSSQTQSSEVLTFQTGYADFEIFAESLEAEAAPEPTIEPTPVQTIKIAPRTQAGSYEIRKPPAPEEVNVLIRKYATEYNVNSDMMIHIARCESNFRENAVSGPYAGIYQFVSTTWISNRKAMGLDPDPGLRFNLEESIRTAAFKMSRDGFGAWPVCQAKARALLSAK